MGRDTSQVLPLLGQRCVVDDQVHSLVSYRVACHFQENGLEWRTMPHPIGDEMVQLVIAKLFTTSRNRLDTLAVTGADQSCNVGWTNPHPGFVPGGRQNAGSQTSRSLRHSFAMASLHKSWLPMCQGDHSLGIPKITFRQCSASQMNFVPSCPIITMARLLSAFAQK